MTTHDNNVHGYEHSGDGTCTVGNTSRSENPGHHKGQSTKFHIPRCSACNHEIRFSEGDVIYGDKWYHSSCWDEIQAMVEMVSQ